MSEPPENAKGAAPKDRARCKTLTKAFDDAGNVKALRMTRWLDMAIVMHRMGATDPAEYQRLGIWLQRMRRGIK